MIKGILFSAAVVFAAMLLGSSCEQKQDGKPEDVESMNSGKLSVYIEDEIFPLLDTAVDMYKADYPNVKLTVEVVNPRNAMAQLLGGNARTIVVSRDYLRDEDSLMKQYNVSVHQRMAIAEDALVIIANPAFPTDTINDSQLFKLTTDKDYSFAADFPKIVQPPVFAVSNINSSAFANFKKLVMRGRQQARNLRYFDSPDSIVDFVASNPNAIGAVYLSKIIKDIVSAKIKPLAVGFSDSTGKYFRPRLYSQYDYPSGIQVNIVQRLYPYIVTYWAYMKEDRRDLPWWFGSYLAKEAKIQKIFKEYGIVPAYAKIKLIQED